MQIGLAQINTTVGALDDNTACIKSAYDTAVAAGADLVVTPELAITGYPPQDLVFKSRFVPRNLELLEELHAHVGEVPLIVGFIDINHNTSGKPFYNAAAVLIRDQPIQKIYKTLLPTYDVFDEDRYFQPADSVAPITIGNRKLGITICEDIWPTEHLYRQLYDADPVATLVAAGAEIIINLSASPFHATKQQSRVNMLTSLARQYQVPFVYCNAIGGNDQLIFDGASLVITAKGDIAGALPAFEQKTTVIDLTSSSTAPVKTMDEGEEIFRALSLGLRDYFRKCGFHSAVLGLSGGIDSALTACIAVDALGADNITGVTMPSRYSSAGSVSDSLALARKLAIHYHEVPIKDPVDAFTKALTPIFQDMPADTTEENIQPRVRATILMALSNKFGHLLLTTGNKSELAVGYCTLYGDMAGGLAVISDVPKTIVYKIARWINRDQEIIPWDTIEKPPSAELKPDQIDQDTLPEYPVLDGILQLYVEEHKSLNEIVAAGYPAETVRWVQRRVDLNEYKREQAAPGLRITSKAFGSGRRMPVAQQFVE